MSEQQGSNNNNKRRGGRAGAASPVDDADRSTSEPVAKQARLSLPPTPAVSKQVTVAQAVHTKLEWKIENFAKVLRLYKPEQNLCSRSFSSPACPSVVWELHLYPNGKREEDIGNASFFLRQTGMQNWTQFEALFAEFQIYCSREDGDKLSVCRDTKEFTHQQGRGKFKVPRERIEAAIQHDGALLVNCEIEFFPPGSQPIVDAESPSGSAGAEPESNHVDSTDWGQLLRGKILPDCVIKVGDECVDAHRCVLALHSDVFRSCFTQPSMVEAQAGVIQITDSFLQPVKGMLEWMYNGHTQHMAEYAESILILADKYGILRLKSRCERYMASTLSDNTVCQSVVFADMHSAQYLLNECQRYISKHQNKVLGSDEWAYLKRHNSRLAADVLQNMITGSLTHCDEDDDRSTPSPQPGSSQRADRQTDSVRVIVSRRVGEPEGAGSSGEQQQPQRPASTHRVACARRSHKPRLS